MTRLPLTAPRSFSGFGSTAGTSRPRFVFPPTTTPASRFPLLEESSFAAQVENSLEKIRRILRENKEAIEAEVNQELGASDDDASELEVNNSVGYSYDDPYEDDDIGVDDYYYYDDPGADIEQMFRNQRGDINPEDGKGASPVSDSGLIRSPAPVKTENVRRVQYYDDYYTAADRGKLPRVRFDEDPDFGNEVTDTGTYTNRVSCKVIFRYKIIRNILAGSISRSPSGVYQCD